MKIQIRAGEQGFDVIDLAGELDFNTSPGIRREFARISEKNTSVLVNLGEVSYIDSSGLATFIELFQKTKRSGRNLILFNLSQSVRGVFEIAKLDSVFKLAASEQDALALLSK